MNRGLLEKRKKQKEKSLHIVLKSETGKQGKKSKEEIKNQRKV